jgi:hypothetical protein
MLYASPGSNLGAHDGDAGFVVNQVRALQTEKPVCADRLVDDEDS